MCQGCQGLFGCQPYVCERGQAPRRTVAEMVIPKSELASRDRSPLTVQPASSIGQRGSKPPTPSRIR